MAELFSVWWWDPDDNHHPEKLHIESEEAVALAMSMTRRPAAMIGVITAVRIVDSGDHTVFEWLFGKGITFPTQEDLKNAALGK